MINPKAHANESLKDSSGAAPACKQSAAHQTMSLLIWPSKVASAGLERARRGAGCARVAGP